VLRRGLVVVVVVVVVVENWFLSLMMSQRQWCE
jgi:hypothetical protein